MVVRLLQKTDGQELFSFFLRLSDETVTLMNRFGKVNESANAGAFTEFLTINPIGDDSTYWVSTEGRDEDFIVGLSWLTFSDKPTKKFTCSLGILVADAYQGQGIGKQLMEAMIEEAKRRGMRKIWLQVYAHNHRATNLYSRFKFREEGYFVAQEWDENHQPLDVLSMGLIL